MRCTEGQGDLFARPLSAEDFHGWIIAHRKNRVTHYLFDEEIPDLLQDWAQA